MKVVHIICKGKRGVVEDTNSFISHEWNMSLEDAKKITEVRLHEHQIDPEYLRGQVDHLYLNPKSGRVVFHCSKIPLSNQVVSNWRQWIAFTKI
jgi:hypothetical protein